LNSSFDPQKDKKPTPRELAVSLAKLARERYDNILPIEYIAHSKGLSQYCHNLNAAISLNELIVRWVKRSILLEGNGKPGDIKEALEERSEVMRFFVQTAEVLGSLNAHFSFQVL
jgi:hypothetical protein